MNQAFDVYIGGMLPGVVPVKAIGRDAESTEAFFRARRRPGPLPGSFESFPADYPIIVNSRVPDRADLWIIAHPGRIEV